MESSLFFPTHFYQKDGIVHTFVQFTVGFHLPDLVRSSKLECAKKAMHAMHQRIQDEAWSDEQIRKAWNLLHKESGWDISEYA